MKQAITITIVGVLLIGFGVFLFLHGNKQGDQTTEGLLPNLPTDTQLQANMSKTGLDPLPAEGTVLHIHEHLDMIINGQSATVPSQLGIATTFFSPIHTHDSTGVIHVESPVTKDFKLSQFFDEWGVTFNDSCLDSYCSDSTHKLIVGVNGSPITNARDYVLKAHDEIEIWYGPKDQNPTLIGAYNFEPGL
jgi:hypothetical protein